MIFKDFWQRLDKPGTPHHAASPLAHWTMPDSAESGALKPEFLCFGVNVR